MKISQHFCLNLNHQWKFQRRVHCFYQSCDLHPICKNWQKSILENIKLQSQFHLFVKEDNQMIQVTLHFQWLLNYQLLAEDKQSSIKWLINYISMTKSNLQLKRNLNFCQLFQTFENSSRTKTSLQSREKLLKETMF